MKKRIVGLVFTAAMLSSSFNVRAGELQERLPEEKAVSLREGEVAVDEENFPDENFRKYIQNEIDKNKDGVLSKEEAGISFLDVSENDICDLKGIEYFTSLAYLYCYSNQLSSLDVSQNTQLETLACSSNQLTCLDTEQNICLEDVSCSFNQLTGLDLSRNTRLKSLSCDSNQLEQLDVGQNTRLETLSCDSNQLSSLDLSGNERLTTLSCGSNQLSSLDVSQNTRLEALFCSSNRLSALDVSRNERLETLSCDSNRLGDLDVSRNERLETLSCSSNQLSSLGVSTNTALTSLNCDSNRLIDLDVSQNIDLTSLFCSSNQLKSLDISANTRLETLSCYGNRLSSLDVSGNTALEYLFHWGNKINISGRQIDMGQYDSDFNSEKVSNLQNLKLAGNIFTISEGEQSGTYDYDCGRNYKMTVEITGSDGEETDPVIPPAAELPFVDVDRIPGSWRYENIRFVYEKGIMTGIKEDLFLPDAPLTRAQFASVIYRMADSPQVEFQSVFADVEEGKWYTDAVIWAYENKIVAGLGDRRYGINDFITREQMARMLMEFARLQAYDVSARADFGKFEDALQVSKWALENMQWAVGSGIISGSVKDGKYYMNPKGQATRAECAVMLTKFLQA